MHRAYGRSGVKGSWEGEEVIQRHPQHEDWEKVGEELGRRPLMQWKWIHQILEKVVVTALKVSLTVQDICEVLARHWSSTRNQNQGPQERRPE